ncbi:MAG TPA: MBL fold metallo-hydrolase [Thermomicrobiales bacterium]|jgi:glyoxylase-like metal-dependent hydrolase (beta-lactamase superfamily II)
MSTMLQTVVKEGIDVNTLQSMLDSGQPVTVLDVRTTADRAEWAIPGSLHVDAYDALKAGEPDALAGVVLPDETTVVTVCGAGKVSLVAAEQLRARGFDAHSLAGGMKAWSLAWNTAEVALPDSAATVVQVRRTGKGCLSYLIGSGGEAAVVDASLAPEVYQELAVKHGWGIRHVLDTHVHADHLSRARVLAERTGATLHLPATNRVAYPFAGLREGGVLAIGDARLTALRTPGHTPEAMCYLLDDAALFTGDTLFLSGVGRPDLEASAGEARERARLLWGSLRRLVAHPPETLVLPGHTSGPIAFDGVPIAATLAEVAARVPTLGLGETAFVETILARLPPTPPNHAAIVAFNETGETPTGDPTDLEAGANRCAVA